MTRPKEQQPAQPRDAEQQHDPEDKTNAEEENDGGEQDVNASGGGSGTNTTSSLIASSLNGTRLGHHARADLAVHAEDSDTVNEDETSSSGSSECETSPGAEEVEQADESEDEGTVAPTGGPTPVFAGGDLRSRLQAFLPQLQRANAELEASEDVPGRRIDHVDDDEEHYIEMNLGLGVLSERKNREDGEIRVDGENSSSDGEENDDEAGDGKETGEEEEGRQTDVLARLRGEKASRGTKRKIEDLG